MRIADLDIVSEHVVEGDLEARNARPLTFALLHLCQIVLARIGQLAQLVKLLTYPLGDKSSFGYRDGWLTDQLASDAFAHLRTGIECLTPSPEHRVIRRHRARAYPSDGFQGTLELHHLARRYPPHGHLGNDPLHVAHFGQLPDQCLTQQGVARKQGHGVLSATDLGLVAEWKEQPALQQSCAHGRGGLVDRFQKGAAAFAHRSHKLKAVDGEFVEPDVTLLLDAQERRDVSHLRVLRAIQINEDGACGHDAVLQILDAEAFQPDRLEVALEPIASRVGHEDPILHLEHTAHGPEGASEAVAQTVADQHLLRRKVRQPLVHRLHRALSREELARRNIQKSHPAFGPPKMHRSQKVILPPFQHIVIHRNARGDQLRDPSLDQFLGHFRILQLVAYRHPPARFHQLRQVGIERVIREARHWHILRRAVRALRQHNAERLSPIDSVLPIHFVEVAHAKEQNGLRMLGLNAKILLHQGGFDGFCHSGFFLSFK